MVGTRSYFPFGLPYPIDRPVDYYFSFSVPRPTGWLVYDTLTVPAGKIWLVRVAGVQNAVVGSSQNMEIGISLVRNGGAEVYLVRDMQLITGGGYYWIMEYPQVRANAGDVFRMYAANNSTAARDMAWQLMLDEIDL